MSGLVIPLVISLCCMVVLLVANHVFGKTNVHVFVAIGLVKSSPPLLLSLTVSSKKVQFEVDTGAGATVLCKSQFDDLFPNLKLSPSRTILHSVNGLIVNAGEVSVNVVFNGNSHELTFIVCDKTPQFTPLIGRNWLDVILPDWRSVLTQTSSPVKALPVESPPSLDKLRSLFPAVFDNKADSTIKGFVATLVLKANAIPIFAKAYNVAFGILDKVSAHLDNLVKLGKAVPIRCSSWASPGVVVQKKDGSIRYCADFKRTLNPQLRVDYYPLPRPDTVFASLADGAVFTSLDLSDAYTQLELDPKSQELCVLNTHKGLFKLTRLIYGVASAAAIFQSVMDRILVDIPGTVCYLDNILIKGSSMADCVNNTLLVLSRLEKHNVRLRLDKCEWFVPQIEYLGFIVSKEGRRPNPSLVSAILDFLPPVNTSQVGTFLGMLSFYSEFLPNLSTIAKPLRLLTDVCFSWTVECQAAFDLLKNMLVSSDCIMHYNPDLPIVVSVDASPVGVGAVLSHVVKVKGKLVERPVMFASATLSQAQRNYAQVDREALAVVFALSKFHRFLWGREFTLVTDNSAISRIFHQDKNLPIRTGERLQHWATLLQPYNYKLVHRKSELNTVADALSRLPVTTSINDISVSFPDVPLSPEVIAHATSLDPILSKVCEITATGWPIHNMFTNNPALDVYFKLRDSLSLEKKCLMFANRVVIPLSLQSQVLKIIHQGHPGVVRSKLLARSVVWWPDLNTDIETLCSNCELCAKVNFKPKPELLPWPVSKFPFQRVHIDFFHLKLKQVECLIFCDSFSKWLHIQPVPNIRAATIAEILFTIFTMFSTLPETIVTDNGPPFDSSEFLEFCTSLSIVSKRIAPYHPESNGLAERSVGVAKAALTKLFSDVKSVASVEMVISKFLFDYRNTPSTVTHKSPNEMLLSFKPRTLLTILNPAIRPDARLSNTLAHFREGDPVNVKLSKNHPVQRGIVVRPVGPDRFVISIAGVLKHVHTNQLSRAPC